jgi:hypothetical protein
VFTWASGNKYQGDFYENERHGNGQMVWTDGSKYEGEWVNGIQHGLGRMTGPDGQQKEGFFENNVFKHPALAMNSPGEGKRVPAQVSTQPLPTPIESKQRHRSSVLMNNYQQMMSTKATPGYPAEDQT